MEELINICTYKEFKAATDREVLNQAEGFVRLGYLLRKARDTEILRDSGYPTVVAFAEGEYGLTETYVSRYIAINKHYFQVGNLLFLSYFPLHFLDFRLTQFRRKGFYHFIRKGKHLRKFGHTVALEALL